jgi:hypothetical protein
MMNSLLVLLVLSISSVLAGDEYKYDKNAKVLYSYEHDGVQIDVLQKGEKQGLVYY